jgi:hypothetical protein
VVLFFEDIKKQCNSTECTDAAKSANGAAHLCRVWSYPSCWAPGKKRARLSAPGTSRRKLLEAGSDISKLLDTGSDLAPKAGGSEFVQLPMNKESKEASEEGEIKEDSLKEDSTSRDDNKRMLTANDDAMPYSAPASADGYSLVKHKETGMYLTGVQSNQKAILAPLKGCCGSQAQQWRITSFLYQTYSKIKNERNVITISKSASK